MKERKEINSFTRKEKSPKGGMISITNYLHDDGTMDMEVSERVTLPEKVIRESAIFRFPRTLWDKFDLHPISQMKDLGSLSLSCEEKEGGKYTLKLSEITNQPVEITQGQARIFEILLNSDEAVSINRLQEEAGYKDIETARKAKDRINHKFAFASGQGKVEQELIEKEGYNSYKLNPYYRLRSEKQ